MTSALGLAACGKKGPPLPPLVKLPMAPADFNAIRRGDTVDVQFTVPSRNTDDTRPANVERVDVYALTGADGVSMADVIQLGAKVASVAVKAPRDPDRTIEADEPAEDLEPLEGRGLDQGARVRIEERLTAAAFSRPETATGRTKARAIGGDEPARPLPGASALPLPSRTYVGVGISKNGRKGPTSPGVTVPLVPPPPAPEMPTLSYTETVVTVTWPAVSVSGAAAAAPSDLLPSRAITHVAPTIAYHVYEVAPTSGAAPPSAAPGSALTRTETLLTTAPLAETRFSDPRITWDATRCYAIRAVERTGDLTIESDARLPACVTFKDTFPPVAPRGLSAVASEGAVSLIWEPSDEKDLDGYLVLRGVAPGDDLKPLTQAPIHETNFRDAAQPGERYVYAVRAVDKAGNVGPPSSRIEETAR